MLAILLDHTEIYYTGKNIIDYNFYVVNVLVIFFFLSGYLMYKATSFDIKHKLDTIFRRLLIPYFTFTTLIALPKAFVHDNSIDIHEILLNILTGQASWFVAALCVAEFLFAGIIWISKGKNIWICTCGLFGLILSIYLSQKYETIIWQLDNALQALLFLSLGYLYHKYESTLNCINKTIIYILLFFLLITIKIYEYYHHISLLIWHIHITNYYVFLIDIIICNILVIKLFKNLPSINCLSWIGRHSIAYYFLCGGVPLLVSIFLTKIGFTYRDNYLEVVTAFIMVCLISTIIVYGIYRYIPFIIGKK